MEFYDRESILEHAEEYAKFFKQPKRKYEISEKLNITRAETELLLEVLGKEELIKNTSVGWQWNQ